MAITIKDLKAIIAELPDDMMVVQSKDSEGNSYSPTASWDQCVYVPECTWEGYLWEYEEVDGEDDVRPKDAKDVLVLWPTN